MLFQERIRLSCPNVGEDELEAVRSVFEASYLGMSTQVHNFEDELKQSLKTGASVVCVNNATGALMMSLLARGIGHGDEVLVPSLTYVATFQAISATGAIPIPCDISENGLLCLNDVKGRLTSKTRAIIYVHYASQYHNRHEVFLWAKSHGLVVIEDAAHSFSSLDQGQSLADTCDILCFSFGGIKNITSGEGGALVTHCNHVIERVKDMRLLGVCHDTEKRFAKARSFDFDVVSQGYRFHMSDIMAAIGRVQLRRAQEFHEKRRFIVDYYHRHLKDIPWLTCPRLDNPEISPHIYPLQVLNQKRDALRDHLMELKIETGIHYKPCHLLSFYKAHTKHPLKEAESFYAKTLSIPLHTRMGLNDVERVVEGIQSFEG